VGVRDWISLFGTSRWGGIVDVLGYKVGADANHHWGSQSPLCKAIL